MRERLAAAENYVALERANMEMAMRSLRECGEVRIKWSHDVGNLKVLLEKYPDWSGKVILDLQVKNKIHEQDICDWVNELIGDKDIQVIWISTSPFSFNPSSNSGLSVVFFFFFFFFLVFLASSRASLLFGLGFRRVFAHLLAQNFLLDLLMLCYANN